ncbi:MAG: hypothetical protein ACKVH8_10585 [Pirellulales bacterium]
MANPLALGSTADDSGVIFASSSNIFGTSSVSPQAIRGYSGQEFTELKWNSGAFERLGFIAKKGKPL